MRELTSRQDHPKRHTLSLAIGAGQGLFATARFGLQTGPIGRSHRLQSQRWGGLRKHPLRQRVVVIVAAQGRIAARGQDLEDALGQSQDRNIEGAATQVVDSVDAFCRVVQAIGNGRGGRLVDESQHFDPRELGRVFGGLSLGIVEIRGHRDDRTEKLVIEAVFGPKTQRGQDLGADLHRCFAARHRLDDGHAVLVHHAVGQAVDIGDLRTRPTHQTFGGGNGVGRVFELCGQGVVTHLPP